MGTRINTNIEAFNAQRNLQITSMQYQKSVEKLSSGLRINRAGDDAAGLSISEKLRAQIKGLGQAQRNAQDGISMIQTAEGALNETHSILQRMRELAVQASNGTLSTADMGSINGELQQLNQEVDRIAQKTTFNGKALLDNSLNTTVCASGGSTSEVQQGFSLSACAAGVVVSTLDVSGAMGNHVYQFSSTTAGKLTLTDTTTNVAQTVTVGNMQTSATASQTLNFSTLGVTLDLSGFSALSGAAANLITSFTLAASDTIQTSSSGGALTLQIGANTGNSLSISIKDGQSTSLGTLSYSGGGTTLSASIGTFNGASTIANAQTLLTTLDNAITDVSGIRGDLGASQNRLEHTIANLGVSQENLTASESRIRDVDMAAEMVNFTKTGILQQAGQSILSQANSAPRDILQLLRG
jgi:flagellin